MSAIIKVKDAQAGDRLVTDYAGERVVDSVDSYPNKSGDLVYEIRYQGGLVQYHGKDEEIEKV